MTGDIPGILENSFGKNSAIFTKEEFQTMISSIIEDVAKEFKEGNKIIHYSDYDLFAACNSKGCGREAILIQNDSVAKEIHLIRRSCSRGRDIR